MDNSNGDWGCLSFLVILAAIFAAALSINGCSAPSRDEAVDRSQIVVATVESRAEDLAETAEVKAKGGFNSLSTMATDLSNEAVEHGKVVIDKALFHAKALEIKISLYANKVWESANGYSIRWVNYDVCNGWAVFYFSEYKECIGLTEADLDRFLK